MLDFQSYKKGHEITPRGTILWNVSAQDFQNFLDFLYEVGKMSYSGYEYARMYHVSKEVHKPETGRAILQEWQGAIVQGKPGVSSNLGNFLSDVDFLHDWETNGDEIREFFRVTAAHLIKSDTVKAGAGVVGSKNETSHKLLNYFEEGGRFAKDLIQVFLENPIDVKTGTTTADTYAGGYQGPAGARWDMDNRLANDDWKPVLGPWPVSEDLADEDGVNDRKTETAAPTTSYNHPTDASLPPPSQIQTLEQSSPKSTSTGTALQNSDERCSISFSAGDIFTDVVRIFNIFDH